MLLPSKYCIMGVPDHSGVINVGGRIGAARGPEAFRRAYLRLRGRNLLPSDIEDLGDVPALTSNTAANHVEATAWIKKGHPEKGASVVVGGGHDHGFTHLKGISEKMLLQKRTFRLGCINIDAHLDVRKPSPLISSGSPFYLALESGVLSPARFIEFGIQSHCNSPELWKYAEKKKIKVVPFRNLRAGFAVREFKKALSQLKKTCDGIVISLDLDAAASAYAPGVSAPQSEGFTGSEVIEMCEIAGSESKVISLGIFELNPEHDRDDQTAKLAATAAYHFFEFKLSRLRKV